MKEKHAEVYEILSGEINRPNTWEWKLSLLMNYLQYCDCVVTEKCIEISIRVIPTEIIPAYEHARKILLTATLPDDTIVCRYLGVSEDVLKNIISPSSAADIGERLIIVPQEINPGINNTEIIQLIEKLQNKYKVVALVPSKRSAEVWEDIGG